MSTLERKKGTVMCTCISHFTFTISLDHSCPMKGPLGERWNTSIAHLHSWQKNKNQQNVKHTTN